MDKGSLVDYLHLEDSGGKGSRARPLLEPPILAAIAYQMLWGLSFLHFENLLHRDIKPANVLVSSAGCVKLSDFGISSQRDSLHDMNSTVIGTQRFMSPERLRGKSYGSPSDIWSFGLVLLECTLGESPFRDVSSVFDLVITIEEVDLDALIPKHSARNDFREVILSCLQMIPEMRVPAEVLILSPTFAAEGVHCVNDAVSILKAREL